MDSYKSYQRSLDQITWRRTQELKSMTPIKHEKKLPYRPHIKRSVGEYYPTIENRIDLLKYLSTHLSVPLNDQEHLVEKLKLIEHYEYRGIYYGILHSTIMFFLPGIRSLPLYKRILLPALVFIYWKRWGYNLGRDFVFVKGRNVIENWERDFGIRNNQTAY